MWTTGSVIFLSSLSHSFFLRKTHFCRLCQFFSAFSPSWPPLRSLVAYPVGDSCPSDVDLLAIFDMTDRLVKPYREDIFATIIDACALHLDAPREVNVLLSDRTMHA